MYFGNGGELRACSSTYCSKQSAGETGVGNTSSNNYQAQAGFNTDREPYLELNVNGTNIDLGVLDSLTTKTANATFSVKTYLAGGYIVATASDPPRNGSDLLDPMSSAGPSSVGTEQFGINLAANTSPATFGAAPSQVPDGTFSYGDADTDYATPNVFKYLKGDTIASSDRSSGQTDYTISYIFNVSNVTPGGTYSLRHVLVATSTF
jgi:hypothetical protein